MKCPVCNSASLRPFIYRTGVPVHQNYLFTDRESAMHIPVGNLKLAACENCCFIFNEEFDMDLLSYGDNYDNSQTYSESFEKHIDELIDYLIHTRKTRNHRIVEVGCGKGDFLKKLIARGNDNLGFGFDPSYLGPDVMQAGRLKFFKSYFDADSQIQADSIICRHVIEHIPYPVSFLASLQKSIPDASRLALFFETPCVAWILENKVFWDFFYEHCSYFTKKSLSWAFQQAGFAMEKIRHIFGGQYLWAEGINSATENYLPQKNDAFLSLIADYQHSENDFLNHWQEKLQNLSFHGNVALWGAGAKGVTFANLLDKYCATISCIIDINPTKQNKFLPGTGHPIISPSEIKKYRIDKAIIMNNNYYNEINNYIISNNIKLDLITY